MTSRQLPVSSSRRTWVGVFAAISIAMLAGGYWYYRGELTHIYHEKYQALAAIGELKSSQIQHWRTEHLAHATRVARNPLVRRAIAEFLRDPRGPDRQADLLELLKLEQMEGVNDAAVLHAPDGHILLTTKTVPEPVSAATRGAIAAALATRDATLSAFFAAPGGSVHIDAAAAVRDTAGQPIAVAVLRSNAATYLYPLIQSWPTPSPSAETLLIERDGNDIVFLNELRHRPNTALILREPLTRTDVSSVQAALGTKGAFWGKDYRDVQVLADLRAIPGSPWFLVAKVDADEILADVRYRTAVIGAIVGLCILLAAGATAWAYRRRQAGILRDLYESERQQREAHKAFRTTLYSIGDAVITTDTNGCVREMNPVAERLTGWSESEARGRPLEEVFRVIDGETRAPLEGPARSVLRSGTLLKLAEHTLLIGRDGTERPIADSAAPIRDDNAGVTGVVLVFSDETARHTAQHALAESEGRVRLALAAANQGLYDLDVRTGEAEVSPEYATMLGYDPAEFHENVAAWIERMHPDDREPVARVHRDYLAGRLAVYRVEVRQRTKTGDWRWILSQGKIVERALDGRPLRMLGTHTDITERRQAEQALGERARELLEAQRIARLGSYRTDFVAGTWESSVILDEIFGIADPAFRKDVPGWLSIVHPDEREEMSAYLTNEVLGNKQPFDHEYRIVRHDDHEERWVHGIGELVVDSDGRPVKLIGTIQDITERKRAEAELHLQSTALNAAASAIVITDRGGTIVWINQAFVRLTGYSAKEAIGENPRALLKSGVHDHAFYKQLWDTLLAGDVWSGEITNRRKNGTLYAEELTITPVKDARGETTHFIAIKRDLTEEKQLQAQFLQAQKMESVGRLAGGIAHDFNNLLTVIMGAAEMAALDLQEDNPLRAELREIRHSGERAAELTRQLLAFSRKQILNPVALDLNTVVTGMQGMIRRLLGEDIDLVVVPTPGLGNVRADPGQIEQVVLNLAVNARDAMASGGMLTIETQNVELDNTYAGAHPSVQPGPHVMMAISDTGIGMDEATIQRIFEPFFTTKELSKGTGLGLSTVYGIIKQSGGSIWVYSELGRGTTFKIYLPRVNETAEQRQPAVPRAAAPGTGTILVVEDDEGLRALAGRVLRAAGYAVIEAASGEEALTLLARHDGPVHLMLTDMILPGMSGWELAAEIAHGYPETKILYTSGYADEAVMRNRVLDRGVPFIAKPYSVADLTRTVQEMLGAG